MCQERRLGVATSIVIERNLLKAPLHLRPVLNEKACRKEMQRTVQVSSLKDWPALINVAAFCKLF